MADNREYKLVRPVWLLVYRGFSIYRVMCEERNGGLTYA